MICVALVEVLVAFYFINDTGTETYILQTNNYSPSAAGSPNLTLGSSGQPCAWPTPYSETLPTHSCDGETDTDKERIGDARPNLSLVLGQQISNRIQTGVGSD